MTQMQLLARGVCCLVAILLFTSTGWADTEIEEESEYTVGGPMYAKKYDRECEDAGAVFAKDLKSMPLFSNAFFDAGSGAYLCFHIFGKESDTPQDMVYQISDREANLLDALTPPMSSSPTPLVECNVWNLYFEDYNQDNITDILLGIGCFKPQGQGDGVGQGDSVVYLSSVSENTVWLRQREDVNRAIASLPDYAQAGSVIRSVLAKKAVPHPPFAPPPPAPKVAISTCFYETTNGPDILTFNDTSGAVIGSFPNQAGTVAGIKDAPQTRGVWRRGAKKGDFELFHESWGYFANWKYSGDADWRGEWTGKILNCE